MAPSIVYCTVLTPIFHCGDKTDYCCDWSSSQGQRVTAVTVSLSNHKEISDEFASSHVLVCMFQQVCRNNAGFAIKLVLYFGLDKSIKFLVFFFK